jgi:hypothetical protein
MFSNSAVPLTGSQSGISNKLVAPQNAMVQTKSDFLALNDLDAATLVKLLERTQRLASFWKERRMPQSLAGKRIGLVVNDTGWRSTTAFDLGIQSMGGLCVHAPLRWDTDPDSQAPLTLLCEHCESDTPF